MRRRRVPAAWLLLLGAVVASCGAEPTGGRSDADVAAESPSVFNPSTATLSDQPFCEQVDPTLVAAALSMSADQVTLREEHTMGQGVEGSGEGTTREDSESNGCAFGSATREFVASVRPDSSRRAVQDSIDFYTELGRKGYSTESCRVEEEPTFGDPAAVATCEDTSGTSSVVVTALVGGSGFFCSTTVAGQAGLELRDATVEACRDIVTTLAAGG